MGTKFKTLQIEDRLTLERMVRANEDRTGKYSIRDMARALRVTKQTIFNELKRGEYKKIISSTYETVISYSPEIAQAKADMNKAVRGTQLKIGSNRKLADYLEHLMYDLKYSPEAALLEYRKSGKEKEFGIHLCVTTIYSYIGKGVFFNLTNKDLSVKGAKKNKKKKVRRIQKRNSAGTSIDDRPEEILERIDFGNWEIDLVIGKQGKHNALCTLTERKTRKEIIRRVKDKTAAEVVRVLNDLEREYGSTFLKIFKSITADNGQEFSDCAGMEKSVNGGKRTKMYYAHAYSSWERGSNERNNRMIRRWIKKGKNIDLVSDEMIEQVEEWMNDYPRGIFEGRSAEELYKEELEKIAA